VGATVYVPSKQRAGLTEALRHRRGGRGETARWRSMAAAVLR
jgi:hypothetical protein